MFDATERKKSVQGCAALALLLAVVFFPFVIGSRTLLLSSWDAPSIMNNGAYDPSPVPLRIGRTPDPGAPAWVTEPWLKLMQQQLWTEHALPLWNPYSAYGTPLAAAMQPQPYFPLTLLTSLHVSPWTYNLLLVGRLLVAGVLMFLFMRLFVSALASAAAAVTFMLTGYFTIFINMPHLSVEVVTPGLFLAFELLLRRRSWCAVALAAGMTFLSIVGGMPESTFLALAFACLYFMCRLLFVAEFRADFLASLGRFVAAIMLGFCLSAFLLLPFVEFLQIGHDVHQPANVDGDKTGLNADGSAVALIFYLLPLIFGPVNNSIMSEFMGWTGIRSYWGIVPCIFAMMAVASLVRPARDSGQKESRFLTIFFVVTLTLMLLKRFGHPAINWIGALPISEMVLYTKYQEPMIALCAAALAGLGFSSFIQRRFGLAGFLACAVAVLAIMLAFAGPYWRAVAHVPRFGFFYYISLAAGVMCIAGAMALIVAFFSRRSQETKTWLARGLFGLLCLELAINYIAPAFYMFGINPPTSRSPYNGAPYVDFLRARNTDHARIFGRESLLYPNWSAAFGMADARSLDAMYDRRYIAFIRNFLLKPGDNHRHGDLADRFTGAELPYDFETDLEKRFLMLSSIRYLISSSEYEAPAAVLNEILTQQRGKTIWGFGSEIFRLGEGGKSAVRGFIQHPPSSRIPLRTRIDPQAPIFEATAAIKAEAADKSDGAGFKIEVRDGDAIELLFSATLNPRDIALDRAGRSIRLDLSKYAGREVELLFSTDPGPSGSNLFDWAGWTKLRFVGAGDVPRPSSFTEIYDREARVYEFSRTLPRAALFGTVEIVPDREVLNRLKDPAFKPDEKVVLSRETIPDMEPATLHALVTSKPMPAPAAHITRYQSSRVAVEADTTAPSVLMLTDTNYPGWRAYLNGRRVPIVSANYLFRGVVVPPGKNVVEFAYEPNSFRLGAAIALAALIMLSGLLLRERRQRIRRALRQTH
jgi:hypothetical protein